MTLRTVESLADDIHALQVQIRNYQEAVDTWRVRVNQLEHELLDAAIRDAGERAKKSMKDIPPVNKKVQEEQLAWFQQTFYPKG